MKIYHFVLGQPLIPPHLYVKIKANVPPCVGIVKSIISSNKGLWRYSNLNLVQPN